MSTTDIGWHPGEAEMQRLLNGHIHKGNPTWTTLPKAAGYRVASSSLAAFGALDKHGRPWTTVWGGEHGFVRLVAKDVLGIQSIVDLDHDPVVDALFGETKAMNNGVVQPGPDERRVLSGLSIELETRDRVKVAGQLAVGAISSRPRDIDEEGNTDGGTKIGRIGEVQVAMVVEEALGNCPKYLNKKTIRPRIPRPRLLHDSDSLPLPQAALALVERADMLFLSSTNGKTMDTNYRGGPPGFVRVASNSGGPSPPTLIYPEYSGNRFYQTLGNLQLRPLAGIVIPDCESGDVLYLTGRTKILVGNEASAYMPHTKLAVCITVDRAILVADGLPFRGSFVDYSPYNPPVRRLAVELEASGGAGLGVGATDRKPLAIAVLKNRQVLTPTVSRFTFTLDPVGSATIKQLWKAGQYATLDFGAELDIGWSHMRDDDPQSLNDDYIRTFTVSNPPPSPVEQNGAVSMELTLRRHGPVTAYLWQHNMRVQLDIPVLAFGGDETFRIPAVDHVLSQNDDSAASAPEEFIFVAAGVGITPLLAQAAGLLASSSGGRLRVLWALRAEDLPLAVDSFKRIDGLAQHTTLLVTGMAEPGNEDDFLKQKDAMKQCQDMGAAVVEGRRLQREDIVPDDSKKDAAQRKIYVCTGEALLQDIQKWLPGENCVWESFAY